MRFEADANTLVLLDPLDEEHEAQRLAGAACAQETVLALFAELVGVEYAAQLLDFWIGDGHLLAGQLSAAELIVLAVIMLPCQWQDSMQIRFSWYCYLAGG